MTKDRTGEEVTEPEHHCRNGWLTPADSDAPRLCPRCRDKSRRRMRPVQHWFEPMPSERAAAAIAAADDAERSEHRSRSRGHNVRSPVTLPKRRGR